MIVQLDDNFKRNTPIRGRGLSPTIKWDTFCIKEKTSIINSILDDDFYDEIHYYEKDVKITDKELWLQIVGAHKKRTLAPETNGLLIKNYD